MSDKPICKSDNDNKEKLGLSEAVKYVMARTGWSRKKAEKQMLKALQKGELTAYGEFNQ